MAKKTLEGRLKDEVKKYLDSIGAVYYMPVPAFNMTRKMVDFLICYKGRFIALETKIHPRKVTTLQAQFICEVIEAGGIAFVAYELDQVKQLIEDIDLRSLLYLMLLKDT